MAYTAVSPKTPATAKPNIGSKTIWQNNPMNTGFGCVKMRRKSATVNVMPSVTMMIKIASGRTTVDMTLSCMAVLLGLDIIWG